MEYEQGSSIKLYATFVTYKGVQADVSSGAVVVSHINSNREVIDVAETALSLLSGSTYYYDWSIPIGADKGSYATKYIGSYSDGSVVVGEETFQVITKKFYDKKGGGFVQRIKADVWTEKEKEAVIDALNKLTEGDLKSKLLSLRGDVSKMSNMVFGLSEGLKAVSLGVNESKVSTSSNITSLKLYFDEISEKLSAYKESIKELSEKEINFDDSNIVNKLGVLSRSVGDLGTGLRNERLGRVIAELEDLHKKFDEFEEVFAEIQTLEVKERIKNELKGTNSPKV
ncbi:MAG: hypothetical protein ABIB71_08445 [Candidatus Woesearchaeota archaeon]